MPFGFNMGGLTKRGENGISILDAIGAYGGMMAGDSDPFADIDKRRAKAEAQAQEAAILGPIQQLLAGQGAPGQGGMQGPGMDGAPISPGPGSRSGGPDMKALTRAMIPAILQSQGARGLPAILQMLKEDEPKPPAYVEGPDGIYERGAGGWNKAQGYPTAPRPAPAGFQWIGDRLQLIPGYAEGQGALTGSRRDAVVSRPMPRSSNGHGSGGARSGKVAPRILGASLPDGY